MSEVYVHQDEQETTKKAPYLLHFSTITLTTPRRKSGEKPGLYNFRCVAHLDMCVDIGILQ